MTDVRILCIGDVVGKPGRQILAEQLPRFIREKSVDLVVCNAENAASGSGLTPQMFSKLLRYGVDVVTMGDHVYRKRDLVATLTQSEQIVRPANLLPSAAGRTFTVVKTKDGKHPVAVSAMLGQMYMGCHNSPWPVINEVWNEIPDSVCLRVLDFHAEATSEKIAMGWYLDGRATVVFGTHTHVPTADARVLPQGTAYVTDVGMTGPYLSVLGRRKEAVLSALTTGMPTMFAVASDDLRMCGVLVTADARTGQASAIERVEVCGMGHTDEEDSED